MEKENKNLWFPYMCFGIGFILLAFCLIGYLINNYNPLNDNFAQWSQNKIDECYNTNNNTLECYKLCRNHEWVEDFCLERHKT